MTDGLPPSDAARPAAASYAGDSVKCGMRIGLGTGSTAGWPVRRIGEGMDNDGLTVRGVRTSEATAELARRVAIPAIPRDGTRRPDVTVDGTDGCGPDPSVFKGGGGPSRERSVATASEPMEVTAEASKRVRYPGQFPPPVGILRSGNPAARDPIEGTLAESAVPDGKVTPRMSGGSPSITDGVNHIQDLRLKRIDDTQRPNRKPNARDAAIRLGANASRFAGRRGRG